ncbi:hypothetical protein ACUW9N_000662 [Staphylococcus auricularis]|nr:Uncharacterised protein [Staphylococcus auricularis]
MIHHSQIVSLLIINENQILEFIFKGTFFTLVKF